MDELYQKFKENGLLIEPRDDGFFVKVDKTTLNIKNLTKLIFSMIMDMEKGKK